MKRSIVGLLGVALIAASAVRSAAAQSNAANPADDSNAQQTETQQLLRGGRRFGGDAILRILRVLDLSDDQKAEIEAILKQEQPGLRRLMTELFRVSQALREATAHGHFDERVRALAERHGQLSAELISFRARVWSKIYATLTPEQQAKADLIFDFLHPVKPLPPGDSSSE